MFIFYHAYLEEEKGKSMIHTFTVTFGEIYLTGMVTSDRPYETFSLIESNILRQSKIYKHYFENSNFCGIGHIGYVTYSFINMLFISTEIFYDKLLPQILSVGTTANSPLRTLIPVSMMLYYPQILSVQNRTETYELLRNFIYFD